MQVYLRTLGTSEIDAGGEVVALSAREAAVLTYICTRPLSRATRSEIVSLFWPDIDSSKGRHSLSQLLYALRRRVPALPFVSNAESIELSGVDIDIVELRRDYGARQVTTALTRYGGRFLPSSDLLPDQVLDWRDNIEADVAGIVSSILQELSHTCSMADLPNVITHCHLILAVHPHLASAQIALIEATARSGDRADAERHYRQFSSDPEAAAALPPLESFLAQTAGTPEMRAAPFSGRENEIRALLDCWSRVQAGEGQVAVVLGEPGIGKTRLADQLLRRIALRGGTVWVANCCAATQRLPYTVVKDIVNEYFESPTDVWPTRTDSLDNSIVAHASWSASEEYRHRLTESVTSYVIARSQKQPIAILIDDAQWADEFTALLLAYWAYRLRGERVLILLTVRTHEVEPLPEWIESDLGRPLRLTVGRLSVAAAEEIVIAYERNAALVLERTVKDAVLWQSGGRPFLLLEALASVVADGPGFRVTNAALTEPAEFLLLRRFRNMSGEAASVLGLLAVWGRPVITATLQTMTGLTDDVYAAALDTLHIRGIAHLHDGHVTFPHDLMRETAYRSLMPATRVLYHKRVAVELAASAEPAGLIAQHYGLAGEAEAAGVFALRAAEQAWSAHSYSDYEFYCRLCIDKGLAEQKRRAATDLARYLVQAGRSFEIEELIDLFGGDEGEHKALALVSRLERDLSIGKTSATDLLQYAQLLARDMNAVSDPARASLATTLFSIALDACAPDLTDIDVGRGSGDKEVNEIELQMSATYSVWHAATHNVHDARVLIEGTFEHVVSSTSPNARAACHCAYGTILLLSGEVQAAHEQFDVALPLAIEAGDVRRQLSIAINSGVVLMERGEIRRAREHFEKAVTSPNTHYRVRTYTNLAILHFDEGDTLLAVQAAEAVRSMNVSYKSPSPGCTSNAILGLIAIRAGDIGTAERYAEHIRQCPWSSLDDPSYTAIFLAQMLSVAKRESAAIELLSQVAKSTSPRDVLASMRIQCEMARLLKRTEPEQACRITRAVASKASALGATCLAERARRVLIEQSSN